MKVTILLYITYSFSCLSGYTFSYNVGVSIDASRINGIDDREGALASENWTIRKRGYITGFASTDVLA